MPEDCLAVCLLNLRNWDEILTLKCLIDNAVVAFEGAVSSGWIGAQKGALLVLMNLAESQN